MIKIRKNCFETNSSSTHALCLDTKNNFPRYTQEHLDAFTYTVQPFKDDGFDDPHIFSELTDKLRYFWTIWLRQSFYGHDETLFQEFMGKLQSIVPNAVFAYQFPHYTEVTTWYSINGNTAYMEDSDYVLDEEDSENILYWSVDKIKDFLLNGVIIFGDRDNYDYSLMESKIELFIKNKNLTVLDKVTG